MSSNRGLAQLEWQRYKAEIHDLYVGNGKSLKEVMAILAERHDFHKKYINSGSFFTIMLTVISKEQYVRQLKKWNMSKNTTDAKWKLIGQKLQQRKLNGKASAVFFNGEVISASKLKKEMARHVPSALFASCNDSMCCSYFPK